MQVQKLKVEFAAVESKLKEVIEAKEKRIEELHVHIEEIEKAKKRVEKVLLDTRVDFQHYIDNLPIHIKSQTDYMVRPVYLDEIGRVKTIIWSYGESKPLNDRWQSHHCWYSLLVSFVSCIQSGLMHTESH